MKKVLYILLFIGFVSNAQVNVSTYGAVGNGSTNDTAALQAAFDSGNDLISDAGKTYLISGTLNLDTNNAQVIDFNGSTITRNTTVHWMIDVDKRNYSNSLTTIKNLILDGNNKGGSGIDIASRVNFENVEIKNIIYNNANGIRLLVYNVVGMYGQSVFDNVDIHDIKPVGNDGVFGNDLGAAHGFIASAQQIPASETQIVYRNSSLYSIWGEDAGGISLFSAGLDISYSALSYWFENVNVSDAQRRAVKNFCGNTTWVDCTFTSALASNPNIVNTMPSAGLFVFAAGSSSTGAKNNVICGSTFQGHPSDPFNSYYTEVLIVGDTGNVGAEFRNCTFTGNHAPTNNNGVTAYANNGNSIQYLSFANCTFGTTKKVRILRNTLDYTYMSTDNTYVDGKATVMSPTTGSYTEPTIAYADCPTIGGIVTPTGITGLLFGSSSSRFEYIDEGTTDWTATLVPVTEESGQTYTFETVARALNDDKAFFTITGNQFVFDNGSTFTPDYETPLDSNTNNIYAADVKVTASPSGSTYTEDMVVYVLDVVDEGGGEVPVTGIAFVDNDQTIYVGETVDKSHTFTPSSPDITGVSYSTEDLGVDYIDYNGKGLYKGTTTYSIIADDNTNGTIQDVMTVTILPAATKSSPSAGRVMTNGGKSLIYVGL